MTPLESAFARAEAASLARRDPRTGTHLVGLTHASRLAALPTPPSPEPGTLFRRRLALGRADLILED